MPTANSTSTRSARHRPKAAGRSATARRAGTATRARKTTKKTTKAKGLKATRAKAARTRAVNQTRQAVHQAELASRDSGAVFGDYAERVVLIPVGVALTARDRVVAGVSGTISTYSSSTKAQAQLRRFERRGATARNRLEREVRKARVRVERQVRKRRREIERTVGDLEDRRETVAKNGSQFAGRVVPELANRVQERILTLV